VQIFRPLEIYDTKTDLGKFRLFVKKDSLIMTFVILPKNTFALCLHVKVVKMCKIDGQRHRRLVS